jgi:hypothetical protein
LAEVCALQAEVKQLQLRVVGKGVQIANRTFQLFDEVKTWVVFKFFTHGHNDAETAYSSFYSQHRTSFHSSYKARMASSIQNLLPTEYGKMESNVDTTNALPALKSLDKWDSNDGGLCYQISRNMGDVEFQLQETIATVPGPYAEAQHITQECLH